MNDELLKIGKGVNDVKNSLKKEIEKKKIQTQEIQTQTQEPAQEEKVPKTQVKDQYDANDEIYYEKNDGKKNIAIFVGYSQEDEEVVNLKPTQGGDVFAVNKSNIIGAVIKKGEAQVEKEEVKSKAEEANDILTNEKFFDINKIDEKFFDDSLKRLLNSIRIAPSTNKFTKEIESIDDNFNVFKFEKISKLYNELKKLKEKIDENYNIDDEKYLTKHDNGLKYAPNSQISEVLSQLKNAIIKNESIMTYDKFISLK